ncbi:hypothetical protein F5J12DRAFT_495270 [Pisolithus orientalis]|uniref:uncharacterized protein n=1 Tax=Pisolithus orientalis TaxID=936130 RepID=UPI00222404DB|nr:uncharacterized protein F5J12DRAFT_495270 [Pisolithus orientalis]KAI6019937.1 hypothetical protein F5J12DRAFT_495270 [Pisolithus orientalis]
MLSLPNIPVEVWRHIFVQIIRIPGLLLTDRTDPFSPVREADLFCDRDLRTRVAMLLVCKGWHGMISELIHEHVHLTSVCQVDIMASRFERSKLYDGRRHLGTHTRRIDISIHNPTPKVMTNLARILRCTPNLEIFTNSNSYTTLSVGSQYISPPFCTSSDVIQAILSTSASSLRRLEWTCNECPSWDDLMLLLRALHGLCSLTLANIYGSYPERIKREYLILPNLRTLILGDSPSFSHASLGNVPLNTLLTMLSDSSDQLPCLQRLEGFSPFSPTFLSTHGYKIRIIRTVAYTPLLPDIIAKCTNLETFITIFPHQFLDQLTHSSLRRIGIFPISEDVVGVPAQIFNAYIMKPLEDLMCQIEQSDLPSLAHVRLRNVGTLAGVVNYPVFIRKWQDRWRSRDVRFDDKGGQSFDADALDADERSAIDS